MFETFLNAILISIMVSVICDPRVVVRDDRVYRYVGNGSALKINLNPTFPSEDHIQNIDSNHLSPDISTSDEPENIPEWLRIQMKDIKSSSEFIDQFLTSIDNNIDNNDMNTNSNGNDSVFLQYIERGDSDSENRSVEDMDVNEERKKLKKLPRIGSPAACIPEMKIVELQTTNSGDELYYPSCVRIPRCSGCCSSQRLQCVAINTSFEDISVIRVKYSTAERRLKFEGFKVFRIERHDTCLCECIQKSSDCLPKQIYSERECRCLCPNVSHVNECHNFDNKYWDYSDCECKCKSMPLCSTGFAFNNNTCRCESEADPIGDHSDATIDMNERYNRLSGHQSVPDKVVDTEINAQNNKALNILNNKGINPDLNDDYRENSGS